MNIKNHTILLKDTSEAEMMRFRQIMLGIWRQQIEDDKNAEQINKLVDSESINVEGFDKILTKGKLTGSSNLLIFTMDSKGINKKIMNETCGNYDWIAINKPEEAETKLKEAYGDKKGFIKNLVWRSHGSIGAAFLSTDTNKIELVITNPSQDESLHYIKELLTNDANVVFTACTIVGYSLQPKKEMYSEGRKALKNFSNFFVTGSNRSLFLNYTVSTATTHNHTRFIFNEFLHQEERTGFLWITHKSIKSYFYNVKINSSGGISLQKLNSTSKFGSNKITSR